MMEDYPAAHSMDTEWFAVDATGNLAIFDSGEGGAVRESNSRVWQTTHIESFNDFWLKMSENNEHRCIQLKIPGTAVAKSLTSKKLQRGIDLALQYENKVLYCWLLELASDEAIVRLGIEDIENNYVVRFAGEPIIVYVQECSIENIIKLVNNKQILAGQQIDDCTSCGYASLFGLFVYSPQNHVAPLPYTRIGKPIVHLNIEYLPEHLQDAISWNCFPNLQFAESKEIQPIEHMRCRTWQGDKWWVDTQGQEHEEHPYHPI